LNRRVENILLLTTVVGLCMFGLIMLYSSSYVLAGSSKAFNYDRAFFVKRQFIGILIGFAIFALLQRVDEYSIKKAMPAVMLASLAALVVVLVPHLGVSVKGSKRWIRLLFLNIQPSEFARFAFIGYFAYKVDQKGEVFGKNIRNYVPLFVVWLITVVLLLLEPDYGMAMLVTGVFFILVFVTGAPMKALVPFAASGMAMFVAAIISSPYRMKRILAFLNPMSHSRGSGYQVVQSLIAFSNGGFLGTGIGAGKQKLFYLPEIHTDYIFSVIGEELGFVGVVMVTTVFLLLLFLCFTVSRRARSDFGRVFALGVGISIALSAFANMSVCLKLLPPKGMVLPFISYGRSSIIAHLAAVGVVYMVSKTGRETGRDEDSHRWWWHRRARISRAFDS